MKSKILVILMALVSLVPWMSNGAENGVSGKWDSDRRADADARAPGVSINCAMVSSSMPGLAFAQGGLQASPPLGSFGVGPSGQGNPGQLPRGGPQRGFGDTPRLDTRTPPAPGPEFSIELKQVGRSLGGSVTARWTEGFAGCIPKFASSKSYILEGEIHPNGKTFTFKAHTDIGGARILTVWRGEILFPDTLLVRRETTSGAAAAGAEELLFHPAGGPDRFTIDGKVEVDGGGPLPRFDLTFFNKTPQRKISTRPELPNGFGLVLGRPQTDSAAAVTGSKFSVALPISDYQVGVTNLPNGYFVKSMVADQVDLLRNGLNVPRETGKVRVALVLGATAPPPWVRVSGRVEVPGASRVYLKGEALSDEFSTYLRSGAFEFPQVLPGTYALRVALGNGGNVSRTIVVGDHDVVGIKVLPATVQEMAGEFVPISPGVFEMGCHPEDGCSLPVGVFGGAQQWIKPLVTVRIGKPFELGKHEVTQRQWEAVMGKNPAVGTAARGGRVFTDPDLPVANVSWSDAQKFIGKLNSLKDGYRYRLPTSAEWEYAARAGGVAPAAGGSLTDLLLPQSRAVFAPVNAWHAGNSGGRPHRVGELAPNGWGLHDMLGNVSEWVVDPAKKRNETTRGGTFQHAGQAVSAAMEQPLSVVGGPANGLRLARERVR